MTAEAVSRPPAFAARPEAAQGRLSEVAGLLSVPGFLKLCISNGLAHSFGQRMQGIAVAWLVLEMTGSTFWLGVINGLPAVSIVLFSLAGGLAAESGDPRRVLIASRLGLAATAAAAAVLVSVGAVEPAHLLAYVLIVVGIAAVDMPVARTMMHEAVGTPRLLSASAAQSVFMNAVNICAPVVLGVLIGVSGPGASFWLLAAGYALATVLIWRTASPVGSRRPSRGRSPLSEIAAGLRYIAATPAVASLVGLAFLLPIAGMFFAMVPVYARETLGLGAGGLGVLVASFSVGSLCGSLYLTVHGAVAGQGRRLTLLGVAFGLGVIAFSVCGSFIVACGISLVMGVTAGFWQNMLTSMVQVSASPEMRGRVVAVSTMGFQLMGLGWLLAGLLATALGVQATLIVAGLLFGGLSAGLFAFGKGLRDLD